MTSSKVLADEAESVGGSWEAETMMSHTPLLTTLQRAVAEIAHEDDSDEALRAMGQMCGTSRRQFLAGAAVTAAAATVWRIGGAAPVAAANGPRIVVVGGGLAGLTCAYELRKAGYLADVHEASPDRLGGRCWSIRGYFAEGQIAEHGGELIDQGHTAIRQLAQSLGLKLDNLLAAEKNGTEPLYWFHDGPYTYQQATADIKGIWQKIKSDVQAASYPTLYNVSTERGRQLDHMSIVDWIDESVPGGISSRLGQLLDVAYNIEYGAECSEQSSLNLLYLLGYSGQGQLRIFGPSNEKYHVRGGNDQIVDGLASLLAGQITFGSSLSAITQARRRHLQPDLPAKRQQRDDVGRPGGARPAVCRSEDSRHRQGGVLAAQTASDPRAGDGDELQAQCAVQRPAVAHARGERRHLRRHRLPGHVGGDPRPARHRRHPGRLHRWRRGGELHR